LAGESDVHVVPLKAHVPKVPPRELEPPKRMSCPLAPSYAMEAAVTAGGLVEGDSWLQVVPFHVHVSLGPKPPFVAVPPKRTSLWIAAS
jgi:hypothetical protein